MNYQLTIDAHRQLVQIDYHGLIDLHVRKTAIAEGSKILEKTGYLFVLVDLSNANMKPANPMEESNFASVLSNHPLLSQCRTAYVTRKGQDDNNFIELLAKVRGYRFRHFHNINEAYDWFAS